MSRQAPGEYYHIYNRGMQKQPIFEIDSDRLRLLFLVLTFQGETIIKNVTRTLKQSVHVQSRTLHIEDELVDDILKNRLVELVHFCLMPNHFHLLVREVADDGISKYMQRVLTAYTKYFNIRHNKTGHLFQGGYKSVWVENDEQLMYLSSYIHKNPSELKGWKGKEHEYYWSSYYDCLHENRFDRLLETGIVMDRYKSAKGASGYKEFVRTSIAKEGKKEGK